MDKKTKKPSIFKNPIVKIINNVISWTILTLLILIAAFLLYYVITAQIYASKGEKYEPKFSLYTIISGSMVPNINVYDVVFDKRVDDPKSLKVGDVITFKSTGSLTYGETITHRIIEIIDTEDGLKFRTKGDYNVTPDGTYVEPNNIIGKVLFKIPQLGRIQFLLINAGGWLFIILIPCLGIVIYDVYKVINLSTTKKKINNNKNKKEEKLSKEAQESLKTKIKNRLNSDSKLTANEPINTLEDKKLEEKVNELINTAIDDISNNAKEEISKQNTDDNSQELSEIYAAEYIQKSIDLDKVLKKLNTYNEDNNIELPKREEELDLPKMKKD